MEGLWLQTHGSLVSSIKMLSVPGGTKPVGQAGWCFLFSLSKVVGMPLGWARGLFARNALPMRQTTKELERGPGRESDLGFPPLGFALVVAGASDSH